MQVILLENILKLGKIGDQVEVKNGFARNYLLRQGKVLRASKENGELYGSIKPKEVCGAFKTILKVEINPSQVDLRQEITQTGKYKINVHLHAEVTANVNLHVDKIDSI